MILLPELKLLPVFLWMIRELNSTAAFSYSQRK